MPARRAFPALGVAVLFGALLLSGCSGQAQPPSVDSSASTAPSAENTGALAWADCGNGAQCAHITVPVDYAAADSGTIDLAVLRVPATAEPRLGVLFVNPGGPGASGQDFARSFARDGLEQYDIVGWDPRGVGESAPVRCADDARTDAYLALDGSPDTAAERSALVAGNRGYAEACRSGTGDLIDHLSVRDTARDLDSLRKALGEESLTYYGASYGTAIGAAYAALYPERVGRMVLDAGVEPRRPASVPQSVAMDDALADFSTWCAAESCVLGDQAASRVAALLTDLDAHPLDVQGRALTQTLAASGLATLFGGGEGMWPVVATAVESATNGDGTILLGAADAVDGRGIDGTYSGFLASFVATYCADDDVRTASAAADRWFEERQVAPIFGEAMGTPYLCVGWTAPVSAPLPLPADPAEPILVLGSPGDPVVPFAWSSALSDSLTGAVLVPTPGHGHVAYGRGSACVDALVRARLVEDALPPDGTTCS